MKTILPEERVGARVRSVTDKQQHFLAVALLALLVLVGRSRIVLRIPHWTAVLDILLECLAVVVWVHLKAQNLSYWLVGTLLCLTIALLPSAVPQLSYREMTVGAALILLSLLYGFASDAVRFINGDG